MRSPAGMSHGRRWLAPWKDDGSRPVLYHCVTRVVERRLALGAEEKEKLRVMMRMQEGFSGCRVLGYCIMCSHVHLLLEVPPAPAGGLTDGELLERLRAVYGEAEVAGVAAELAEARGRVAAGLAGPAVVLRIHERYSYRMHDLGEFMKTLLQRFTRWYNKRHRRSGTLWESRFRSVLVEGGAAARAVAAYVDLNPVRAGMVKDAADYRWSGYGEAVGSGPGGSRARAGLVRAWMCHEGGAADAGRWPGGVARGYRMMLLGKGVELTQEIVGRDGRQRRQVLRRGMDAAAAAAETARLHGGAAETGAGAGLSGAGALRRRLRYFTDGVALGGREFIEEVFHACRGRFGPRRRNGARRLRGSAAELAGLLWSARDLRKDIG